MEHEDEGLVEAEQVVGEGGLGAGERERRAVAALAVRVPVCADGEDDDVGCGGDVDGLVVRLAWIGAG